MIPQFAPTADSWNAVVVNPPSDTPTAKYQQWPVVGWTFDGTTLTPIVWFYGVRPIADALQRAGCSEWSLERV